MRNRLGNGGRFTPAGQRSGGFVRNPGAATGSRNAAGIARAQRGGSGRGGGTSGS